MQEALSSSVPPEAHPPVRILHNEQALVLHVHHALCDASCGEKLTGPQAQAAFTDLRAAYPALEGAYLTLVPNAPAQGLPGYRRLALALPAPEVDLEWVAGDLDAALAAHDPEYGHKRHPQRLAPPTAHPEAPARFAARVFGDAGWQSQFKFLPLYRRTWQSMAG